LDEFHFHPSLHQKDFCHMPSETEEIRKRQERKESITEMFHKRSASVSSTSSTSSNIPSAIGKKFERMLYDYLANAYDV
jgi:hypothetical protein